LLGRELFKLITGALHWDGEVLLLVTARLRKAESRTTEGVVDVVYREG